MDRSIEGKAYINGSFETCCIGFEKGKISAVRKILKSNEHIDFGHKLILPGGIDIHVHFRDPGFTHKEDFSTGSLAAVYGGITCVFDMPNTYPPTTTPDAIVEKTLNAKKKSYIDFGLYAALTNNNIENVEKLAKKCSGFKIYLGNTNESLQLSSQQLKNALQKTSNTQKIILIHAENEHCLKKHERVEYNVKDHLYHRPSECEETSIITILNSCRDLSSSKIHICHLSSCEGFEALRGHPNNFSLGVTPHHLFFDISIIHSNETFYKVNPPIRTPLDRETLMDGVTNGFIDVLESDHAPHTLEEKEKDFDEAPPGIPGVETMFPLFLAKVKKQKMGFNRLISLLCEKPAELLNIPKGKIERGRDADLIVVDLKGMTTIKSDNLHSKCGWTPFEGWSAIFPTCVFVRGEKLLEGQEIQVKQGFGRFVGE